MNSIYEINMSNAQRDMDTGRVKKNSKIVEVFSALTQGVTPKVDGKTLDANVDTLKDMGAKAQNGDPAAKAEINSVIRFSIEPKLLEVVRLFDFMGTYRRIGYDQVPMMRTYNYESVDSRFQASSSDVPFAAFNWREYPIGTQTISSGFAVDYRELQSGNFDGSIREGMEQVQIDMRNKMTYYVIKVLYNAIKNAKIKHFKENDGITKDGLDDMLRAMRRYGRVNIAGDYSVVSQLNDFAGFKQFDGTAVRFGTDAIADEIRRNGYVSMYNGAVVTELQNSINWTKLNEKGDDYADYLPHGLLFLIPQGTVSPLQIFLRGGMTTMTGDDIVTRQHLTRFDMEFGAGVAEGMEHQIGLIRDTRFKDFDFGA